LNSFRARKLNHDLRVCKIVVMITKNDKETTDCQN